MILGSNSHFEMALYGIFKTGYSLCGRTKKSRAKKSRKVKSTPRSKKKPRMEKKIEFTIEEAVEDMKLTPWRALQGIKDETLLTSVLS